MDFNQSMCINASSIYEANKQDLINHAPHLLIMGIILAIFFVWIYTLILTHSKRNSFKYFLPLIIFILLAVIWIFTWLYFGQNLWGKIR